MYKPSRNEPNEKKNLCTQSLLDRNATTASVDTEDTLFILWILQNKSMDSTHSK